jgi:hypothetical protein
MDDDRRAPRPIGDYPGGAHWSAVPAEPSDEAPEDYTVSGDVIRFMWDYGVSVPHWDREGLLPHEVDWLQRALGLSEHLIQALTAWGQDMNNADGTAWNRRSKDEWEHAYRELDARARDLVEWLRRELAPRYEVTYKPL